MARAYFITFHTYGTWLHGHPDGSVDFDHNTPGTPALPPDPDRLRRSRAALTHEPVDLDPRRRFVVDAAIREVCRHRGWTLHALNVRTTHVHAVVSSERRAERVMNDLKAYATRRMRESGILADDARPWAYHGSTRHLHSENSLARAVEYALNEQGDPLPMKCPDGWTKVPADPSLTLGALST